MTLDEAVKELEEAIAAWTVRPADHAREERVRQARAYLAEVKRRAEREGQLTLDDTAE